MYTPPRGADDDASITHTYCHSHGTKKSHSWEQRKCSDIANRYDNLRIPVAESKRIAGLTPYYGANGIQDYVSGYTHNGEFVLVAEDGANDLKNYPVQYVNGQIWVNNHAHVLQSNESNATMFLKYLINAADIESVLVGGGRAKLNANVLMDLEFTVPKKDEQLKISSLLDSLDKVITLHQRKYLRKIRQYRRLRRLFRTGWLHSFNPRLGIRIRRCHYRFRYAL